MKYISPAQSAYHNSCSTGDIIQTYRRIIAKKKLQKTILVTGIHQSSAFDTINRNEFTKILKEIVDED